LSTVSLLTAAAGCDTDQPMAGGSCPATSALTTAEAPASLAPPAEAKLLLSLYAEGTQIYTCTAGMDGRTSWVFKAPSAILHDGSCAKVGTHFGGPTWQLDGDGSAVTGAKLAEAPSPGAIPMLLLKGTPRSPDGQLGAVTHIQRIATTGGLPPSEPCDAASAGREVGVFYTADYLFFTAP
jgi:hypothetical protein